MIRPSDVMCWLNGGCGGILTPLDLTPNVSVNWPVYSTVWNDVGLTWDHLHRGFLFFSKFGKFSLCLSVTLGVIE